MLSKFGMEYDLKLFFEDFVPNHVDVMKVAFLG